MLYIFTKYLVRAGLFFFCRRIVFSDTKVLQKHGPLLLACNHPNSFFDALLLGAFFNKPVHFLARGDAFKNPWAVKILTALKAIPIYRLREGKQYLALNDATFEKCTAILKEGGIVLIFTEGLCLHQWKLRPLKKGTARIAVNVWKDEEMQQRFRVLPVSFNYSSFKSFGKNVVIHFGNPLGYNQPLNQATEAEQMLELNRNISAELEKGMLIEENDDGSVRFLLSNLNTRKNDEASLINFLQQRLLKLRSSQLEPSFLKLSENKVYPSGNVEMMLTLIALVFLAAPAIIGFALNLPLYLPLQSFLKKKTEGTVFYHSALFVVLIITYPIYTLLLGLLLSLIWPSVSFWIWVMYIPTTAFCASVFFDKAIAIKNYLSLSGDDRKIIESVTGKA